MQRDPVLETLMLPFVDGALPWPGAAPVLFLQARDGWPLHQNPLSGLVCEQWFKPAADALERSGFTVGAVDRARRFGTVLVLPPRQRDEARALFARAVSQAQPGGRVVACMSNDEGARTGESDLERLAGPLESLSKNKCRVFWTDPLDGPADTGLLQEWLAHDMPRPIANGRFVSQPGLFAWDRIDPASALLAAHLPRDFAGCGADLGAGYGFLAHAVLESNTAVTAFDLYEADARGVALARQNLAHFASRVALAHHWHDVTRGLDRRYDFIVTNPPFHAQSRIERPDLGQRFIAVAAQSLLPGGRLWLVANRHLPYESALGANFGAVRTVAQQDGFKVIEATKAAA